MLHEDLRSLHEDVERLEQAIADRVLDDPKHVRQRLTRDHEISVFLERIRTDSQRALQIYNEQQDARMQEIQSIGSGDTFSEFYSHLENIRQFHKRYPNEPVENLERAYKKVEGAPGFADNIDGMFTGEEHFGRFFDLTMLHEEYLNLPGVKGLRKMTYLQYIDAFDAFAPPECVIKVEDKKTEPYLSYVRSLADYLESFIRRTRPLEDLDKLFRAFTEEFEKDWADKKVPGWEKGVAHTNGATSSGPATEGTGEGVWCADCKKEFNNDNVYKAHLSGKKHIKNAEARKGGAATNGTPATNGTGASLSTDRQKEKAIADREYRVRKLTAAMSTVRSDTKVNVERKAGMTDRERQQELAELYAEEEAEDQNGKDEKEDDEDDDSKIANPLKLPLAWDGKRIPYWLWRLHGLGVEYTCEICGNYVYLGRRDYERHFSEARHIYGLKCLGITQTGLFREITKIDDAERLWEKIQRDRARTAEKGEAVIEMEDSEGNVMPEKVYEDLRKQGLL